MLGVAHWQRYLFGGPSSLSALQQWDLQGGKEPDNPTGGHHRLNVVFISRSWFERGMLAGGGLSSWQTGRILPPQYEGDLAAELQRAVVGWNTKACVKPIFRPYHKKGDPKPEPGCKPTNVSFQFQVRSLIAFEVCS
jgi:hypothetical protein